MPLRSGREAWSAALGRQACSCSCMDWHPRACVAKHAINRHAHGSLPPMCVRLPTGKEVASALLAGNGEVQQLSSAARLPSVEPQAQAGAGSASPSRSHSPQPGAQSQSLQPLAWLPATTAALALRLYALDAALVYAAPGPPARDNLQVR